MEAISKHLVFVFLLLVVCVREAQADIPCISSTIRGQVTYYDVDLARSLPIPPALVTLEVLSEGTVTTTQQTYTGDMPDDLGGGRGVFNFFVTSGIKPPAQFIVRVFYNNERIDLQGAKGTRSTMRSVLNLGYIGPGAANSCLSSEGISFAFQDGDANNKYAKIFTMANAALDFTKAQGYVPTKVLNIKYPLETSFESVVDPVWDLDLHGKGILSFFWPYETSNIDSCDAAKYFLLPSSDPTTNLAAAEFCALKIPLLTFRENTIYLTEDTANAISSTTYSEGRTALFHEYGHFLMRNLRGGSWPVSFDDYVNRVENFEHSWNEYNQSPKMAFIEGWANFIGTATESSYVGLPYSGKYGYLTDIFEKPVNYNSPGFNFGQISSGFRNEVTVGSALFDLYDPANTGDRDGFQTTFLALANQMKLADNTFADFAGRLYSQQSIQGKGSLVIALAKNKMILDDSDGDGLIDWEEIHIYLTDPMRADTDGDGLSDGDEVYLYGTNPLNQDSDRDGVPDGEDMFPLDPFATYGIANALELMTPPGDLNGDGCVDMQDLSIMLDAISKKKSYESTLDLNADGVVNIADARTLVTLFTMPRGDACR